MQRLISGVIESGHGSTIEHIVFTFGISGVSRTLSHQLVRHRAGVAFDQQSQRYVKFKGAATMLPGDDRRGATRPSGRATRSRSTARWTCTASCVAAGIPGEDARFVFPNATRTNLVMTTNLRALIHMSGLRLCTMAQWEIRRLFQLIRHEVFAVSPFLGSFLAPKCVPLGYCDEMDNRDEHCPIRPHKDTVLGGLGREGAGRARPRAATCRSSTADGAGRGSRRPIRSPTANPSSRPSSQEPPRAGAGRAETRNRPGEEYRHRDAGHVLPEAVPAAGRSPADEPRDSARRDGHGNARRNHPNEHGLDAIAAAGSVEAALMRSQPPRASSPLMRSRVPRLRWPLRAGRTLRPGRRPVNAVIHQLRVPQRGVSTDLDHLWSTCGQGPCRPGCRSGPPPQAHDECARGPVVQPPVPRIEQSRHKEHGRPREVDRGDELEWRAPDDPRIPTQSGPRARTAQRR